MDLLHVYDNLNPMWFELVGSYFHHMSMVLLLLHIPNKKYYDPRVWQRKGEEAFKIRLNQAFADLNNVNTLK